MQDETTGTQEKQRQAVVIGAGIAGLLAARVLSEYYEQVLVVERDALPVEPQPRAGTPQSHHLHRVLPRGKMILERLFPGFLDGLLDHGAFSLEHTRSLLIARDGRTALSAPNATGKDVSCSRALLAKSRRNPPGCNYGDERRVPFSGLGRRCNTRLDSM